MQNLNFRTIISVSGKDRYSFLQNILTNDIYKINSQGIIYALLLTPQGKFLYDFFIFEKDESNLYLDVQATDAQEIVKKLKFYKLRSDVNIEILEKKYFVYYDNVKLGKEFCFPDPRIINFGYRIYSTDLEKEEDSDIYLKNKLEYVIPEAPLELIKDKSFPLEYGLDYLNAIDFDKGCYVGQEIITRTKRRGVIRKSIYIVEGENLEPGVFIKNSKNEEIGKIFTCYENKAIAQIRDEELQQSKNQIYCNDQILKHRKASWYI